MVSLISYWFDIGVGDTSKINLIRFQVRTLNLVSKYFQSDSEYFYDWILNHDVVSHCVCYSYWYNV